MKIIISDSLLESNEIVLEKLISTIKSSQHFMISQNSSVSAKTATEPKMMNEIVHPEL